MACNFDSMPYGLAGKSARAFNTGKSIKSSFLFTILLYLQALSVHILAMVQRATVMPKVVCHPVNNYSCGPSDSWHFVKISLV